MNTITITSSEEYKGQVKLFLSNGHEISFATEKLTEYIESNELNVTDVNQGTGLVCDPNGSDVFVSDVTRVAEYIDNNWDMLVVKYYEAVILKGN